MNEKKVTIITLAVLGLILIGGGVGVWYLQFNLMVQHQEELKKATSALKSAKNKQKELPGIKEDVAKLEVAVATETKRIPDFTKYEYDGFINIVEEMRKRSNILITSATYIESKAARGKTGGKTIPPDVHKAEYDLVCIGGYYPLLRFINLMETEQRFMEVVSIQISAIGDDDNPFLRELRMKVMAYTFNLPDVAKKKEKEEEEKPIESTLPPSD